MDRDPNFEPENNHNSDTEQDMSDNEDENIILPWNSNNMTIEIHVLMVLRMAMMCKILIEMQVKIVMRRI